MPVLRLETTDPYLNLALEEYLLDSIDEWGPTLVLWVNDPCVVIGRHQNPWVECDLRSMRRDGLPLVRRISGGGAVYHDSGNTNFSFIAPASGYDQERHFAVVIAGLAALGITAWKTERNDLRVGERKISGNAFRHTKGHSLHHGTLLVHADLDHLTAYLAPSGALIETKATASVRSRVMNLREERADLTHESLWDALERAFVAEYGATPAGHAAREDGAARTADAERASSVDPARITARPETRARARELRSWEWLYGHTPSFVRRLRLGRARPAREIAITVKRGVIADVRSVDSVEPEEEAVSRLRDTLAGIRYDRDAVLEAAPAGEAGEIVRSIAEAID